MCTDLYGGNWHPLFVDPQFTQGKYLKEKLISIENDPQE